MLAVVFSLNMTFVSAQVTTDPNKTQVSTDPTPPKTTTANKTFAKLQNPLKADSIQDVIFLAVDIAMYLGMAFAILSIIFVGFKFVSAQGKPEEISKAKEWLLWIVIGLAVLISARVMVDIIRNTLVESGVVQKDFLKP